MKEELAKSLLSEPDYYSDGILELYNSIKILNSNIKNNFVWIYFIREYKIIKEIDAVKFNKHIKIGHAKNPLKRLEFFQTGNSNELHIDVCFKSIQKTEKIIHNFFKEENIKGEWFFESDRLKEFTDLIYLKENDWSWQKINKIKG